MPKAKLAAENDLSPNAIKYVLRLLRNSIEYGNSKTLLYDFNIFNDMGEFGVPSTNQFFAVLDWLRESKAITYSANKDLFKRELIIRGKFERLVAPDPLCLIEITDIQKIRSLFRGSYGNQVDAVKYQAVVCLYDPKAGAGTIGGKKFKVGAKTKPLFDKLYENIGEWYERNKVLRAIGSDTPPDSKQSTIEINNYVTNLRKATGLDTKQLELNNGNIRLNLQRPIS